MSGKFNENKVVNGAFGELWVNGFQIAEVSACELNVTIDREEIRLAGQLEKGSKITGIEGVGSFTVKQVFTRFFEYWQNLKLGMDVPFMVIVKLDDPSAFGAERFVANGCKFTGDFNLIKFDVGSIVEKDFSFQFKPSDSDYVDAISDPAMI